MHGVLPVCLRPIHWINEQTSRALQLLYEQGEGLVDKVLEEIIDPTQIFLACTKWPNICEVSLKVKRFQWIW
jgi:hypothetical protein